MTDTNTDTEKTSGRRVQGESALTAVHELRDAMRQADLGTADLLEDGETCAISADDAADLARLVRLGMLETFEACADLAACLRAHKLDVDKPYVTRNKINLGLVAVPVAAKLAILLGVPRDKVEVEYDESRDLSRWAHADRVGDLLSDAFHHTTGSTLVDYFFHADCLRCGSEAVIELGRIEVEAARRIARALQPDP